jgi:hypothetical protein
MSTSKTTPAAPFATELERPDIITQRELQAIMDLSHVMDHLIIGIRLRMEAGADVEPGALLAFSSNDVLTDADEVNKDKTAGLTKVGLTIDTLASYVEAKQKLEARPAPRQSA